MKKSISRRTVGLIILGVVFALLVVALILQIKAEGAFTSAIAVRTLVPMAVCAASFVKTLTMGGTSRGTGFYAKAFEKELKGAFSAPEQKAVRRRLLEGVRAYNENRYDRALQCLNLVKQRCVTPDDYGATYLFLGLTYTDMKALDQAIEAYETLLSHDESRASAWNNLGMLYADKGLTDKAAAHYRRATEVDNTYATAFNNMAQLLLRNGEWSETIPFASHALYLKANFVPAMNALAVAHYALGHRAESRRYTDMAVLNGGDRKKLESIFYMLDHGENPFCAHVRLTPELEEAMEHFRRRYVRPVLHVCLPAEGAKVGRSRIGGEPIGDVPTDSHGAPMKMLCAIFCSELNGFSDMPDRGILRFFVADDRYHGFDRNHPTEQTDFRVLFTPDEDAFGACCYETDLRPIDPTDYDTHPVAGCLPIWFEPGMSTPLASDHRFLPALEESLARAGAPAVADLDPAVYHAICEQNTWCGHRIGGYPCFEQTDPREYEPYRAYDVLLLQIVTHTVKSKSGDEVDVIRFGKEGGCQFFIPRDQLRAGNFSDILYWWDDIPD